LKKRGTAATTSTPPAITDETGAVTLAAVIRRPANSGGLKTLAASRTAPTTAPATAST